MGRLKTAKKVLIVDDEESIRNAVKIALEDEGFDLSFAASAKEALEKMKQKHFDLAIVDIFMPEMSGLELCKKISEDKGLRTTKIIVLTVAKFSESGINDVQGIWLSDYIHKPFTNRELLQRIKASVE